MSRTITLSDEAFERLRRERRPHESTSEQILRLLGVRGPKDPLAFVGRPHRFVTGPDELLRSIEEDRDRDR